MTKPRSTADLVPSERQLVNALQHLWFGRIEHLQIRRGEVVLDPWPTTVRDVKFGSESVSAGANLPEAFELKRQTAELFEYVRAVTAGEIRCLEIRHGLPFAMQIEHGPEISGGRRG